MRWRRGDAWGIGGVALAVLVAMGFRWHYDNWLTDFDILTFFLPNWDYLGQRLRQGEIPMWNPYLSSGTPFAGDPSGGWMYLSVMAAFAAFDVVVAFKVNVLFQALLGGIATYLFGRRIGFGPLAAAVAGIAYGIGPNLYGATYYTTVAGQVAAWIPVSLLGAECALQARHWSARLGWSALAGIAVSQMLNSWPGQGVLYGAMILGAWLLWRLVFDPGIGAHPEPRNDHPQGVTLQRVLIVGVALSVFGLAFSAGGVLPRLDFSMQSNIAGGDYSNVIGGSYSETPYPLARTLLAMYQDTYVQRPYGYGTAVAILALFAIVTLRRRWGVPCFAAIMFVFIDITAAESIFRPVLDLVPGFAHIHGHRPIASIWVMAIAPSMLAGAGAQYLLEGHHLRWSWLRRLLPLAISGGICLYLVRSGERIGWVPVIVGVAATGLLLLPLLPLPAPWRLRLPRAAVAGLLALVLIYPNGVDIGRAIEHAGDVDGPGSGIYLFGRDDATQAVIATVLASRDPGTAAEYLQAMQASSPPFRYAGYAGIGYGEYHSYSLYRIHPDVVAVLVNGRSVFLRLEQVAGYNPMHLKHVAEYVNVMNDFDQDYHWTDVFPPAFSHSQLFDMLNTRYLLVDATIPADRADVAAIPETMTEVYRDAAVIVYENPAAYPRAWVVHDVRDNGDGEGLAELAANRADGHKVAFVNASGPLPAVSTGDGSVADAATVVARREESMTVDVTANGDGLLVLSEMYEHNWKAWVDGKAVDILRTNHALRGIPVPAGRHTVTLRYEPRSLYIGMWITGGATAAILGTWAWAAYDWRERRRARSASPGRS